ncbi:hypothetical protein A3B32_01000 [Candidatus Uhrbacteria bacterium RIFCSPLOWO2_01_FULL_53_9]|uniref:Uncharacterized protein n=1 Tax=Candidatus Uhrbacteria bacterium RIFCSPLOWO2_01_FULL_53_9 TaxID=1802403 RepID=A0A1F7UYT6_9BACT|nr:MAG: hypothetical protein A3B32_01000 [Candidatus Uhrbacteria bacterium RIFCSPLOWO2_01_FULL_53_9]
MPKQLTVDTDKGEELPSALDQLTVVGGERAGAGFGQLRQCPLCGQFYRYRYDHDVTHGGQIGWSEHNLNKISVEAANEMQASFR